MIWLVRAKPAGAAGTPLIAEYAAASPESARAKEEAAARDRYARVSRAPE